jgi:hypothetical protein
MLNPSVVDMNSCALKRRSGRSDRYFGCRLRATSSIVGRRPTQRSPRTVTLNYSRFVEVISPNGPQSVASVALEGESPRKVLAIGRRLHCNCCANITGKILLRLEPSRTLVTC